MALYTTPNREGFFWAKMKMSDFDQPCADKWEVVEVVDNNGEPGSDEEYRVAVTGCPRSESRVNFYWGPEVSLPKELL